MSEWLEIIGTTIGTTTALLTIFYSLLKKWFLDLDTYKSDLETLKKDIERDKANTVDLTKAEQKIEKLDAQIASIVSTIEKQSYHIEFLIASRQEIPNQIKDLHMELISSIKDIRTDIARQEEKFVDMQLDIQDLKSRLINEKVK